MKALCCGDKQNSYCKSSCCYYTNCSISLDFSASTNFVYKNCRKKAPDCRSYIIIKTNHIAYYCAAKYGMGHTMSYIAHSTQHYIDPYQSTCSSYKYCRNDSSCE